MAIRMRRAAPAPHRTRLIGTGFFCIPKKMKRRIKRGRPRTGRDPVVPVRLPPKMLKKIDKLADELAADRSKAVRWLLEQSLEIPRVSWIIRPRKGRGLQQRFWNTRPARLTSRRYGCCPRGERLYFWYDRKSK